MNKKVPIFMIIGLILVAIIPAVDFFSKNDIFETNKNIVFEYKNKVVYESEMLPYINYYSRINGLENDIETKNRAIDNYIRSVLMAEFSEDSGYIVNKEEVKEFIEKSTPFLENEKFSVKKYKQFLSELNIKDYVFEEEIKKDLLIMKMMKEVDNKSNIEDYYFNIINDVLAQRRVIKKIKLNMNELPVVYDNKTMESLYENNKEKYKREDFIIFSKNTYIHPLNQSEVDLDRDTMLVETTDIYNDIKNSEASTLSSKIIKGFKNSTMMLSEKDFIQLIGTKNIDKNIKSGTFYIDNAQIENGVLTVYEVTNVTKGEVKSFSEAYYDLTKDYEVNFKINKAYEIIGHYEDIKSAEGIYFSDYIVETVDPLKNDKPEDLYKLVYSLPLKGLSIYYNKDNQNYYFIQLDKIETINLTDEQNKYFRTSQNNMYKQFVLISLYDSIKREYKLVKHKKK